MKKNSGLSRIVSLLAIAALLLVVPVTAYLSQQQTKLNTPAAEPTTSPWGNAANLSWNSSMVAANSSDFSGLDIATLEAWIKPTTVGKILAMQYSSVNQNWQFNLESSGYLSLYNPFWYSNHWAPETVKSTGTLTFDQWHHVAIRFENGTVRVYIDGNDAGTSQTTNPKLGFANPTTAKNVVIGGFDGLIDEARLTTAVQFFGPPPPGPYTPDFNTFGLWHFDTNDTTSTPDSSGNSRHANYQNVSFESSTVPYIQPNQPPIVSFTATPNSGQSPLTVKFANTTTDPEGDILNYYWDFGDGGFSRDFNTSHTYTLPPGSPDKTFTVTLLVNDKEATAEKSTTISVKTTFSVLRNASFEKDADNDGIPNGWGTQNLQSSDRWTTSEFQQGSKSFMFTPKLSTQLKQEQIAQFTDVYGLANDNLALTLWNKSTGTASKEGTGAYLRVLYNDSTLGQVENVFNKSPHTWEKVILNLKASKPYKQVRVEVYNKNTTATYYIDNAAVLISR